MTLMLARVADYYNISGAEDSEIDSEVQETN